MDGLRHAALPVGMAMGLFFIVIGLTSGVYGIVALGVVIGLTGYFSKPKDD